MKKELTLLQIVDSMFPIGGFTHSFGLESYVAAGLVHDKRSAALYARSMLENSVYYNDAAFLHQAWTLPEGASYWARLLELDQLATALKAPAEIRSASQKLAIRFLKLTTEFKEYKATNQYLQAIQTGDCHGHYAIAFALYARYAGISRVSTLTAFYYNTLNGIVTNFSKIIPLSQIVSQKILYELQPVIEKLVRKQHKLPDTSVGVCCIGQEIQCMQHEKLYTRIYIS